MQSKMRKVQVSEFGKLLERYRIDRELKQKELEEILMDHGFPISHGLISKYEHGRRSASAWLIYSVAQSLELTEEEISDLLSARLNDFARSLLDEYMAFVMRDINEAQLQKQAGSSDTQEL